jgi:hypothetical protein
MALHGNREQFDDGDGEAARPRLAGVALAGAGLLLAGGLMALARK